jgi:hypothetical protein
MKMPHPLTSIQFNRISKKAKLSLYLINSASGHEDIRGSRGVDTPFLISETEGGEFQLHSPAASLPVPIIWGKSL